MSDLILPHTLIPGAPENVNDVQENFEAVVAKFAGEIDIDNLAAAVVARMIPVGSILATGAASAPTGWLLCDGAPYLKTTYPQLDAALNAAYGGDATHFNVPDLRGRVPVGVDGAAARLSANDALGNSGGVEKHPLTAAESGVNGSGVTSNPGNHSHGGSDVPYDLHHVYNGEGTGLFFAATSPGFGLWLATGTSHTHGINPDGAHTHTLTARAADQPHQNMQPYAVVNWMIKA